MNTMKILERKSPYIRQFLDIGKNNIICFRFWQAIIASGCPGECAYCFLQTQYPYRRGLYDLQGTIFKNLPDIVPEALLWLKQPCPAGLIIGENQDGLAFEKPYKKLLDITPLELLIPLFNKQNPTGHVLIILSKFVNTEYAEFFGPSSNIIFSWSLSLPSISRQFEKKVPSLEVRLNKAFSIKKDGYRIRFRLDALAPVQGWKKDLQDILLKINEIKPELLTIGALRATSPGALRKAAISNGRDGSIYDYIESKDLSGFKYRTKKEFHIQAFHLIKKILDPSIKLGLCKEDKTIWQAIDASWEGCNCLYGKYDKIAVEKMKNRSVFKDQTSKKIIESGLISNSDLPDQISIPS